MARAFNVSLNFLLIEDDPHRSLQPPMSRLAQRVVALEDLSEEDERSLLHLLHLLLDAIEAENKLIVTAAGVG